jgi:hypothetical protein
MQQDLHLRQLQQQRLQQQQHVRQLCKWQQLQQMRLTQLSRQAWQALQPSHLRRFLHKALRVWLLLLVLLWRRCQLLYLHQQVQQVLVSRASSLSQLPLFSAGRLSSTLSSCRHSSSSSSSNLYQCRQQLVCAGNPHKHLMLHLPRPALASNRMEANMCRWQQRQ